MRETSEQGANEEDLEADASDQALFHAASSQQTSEDSFRADAIERALQSLSADAQRADGTISRTDVNRTYLRRQLSIAECMEVEVRLINTGIEIKEDDSDEAEIETGTGSNEARPKQKYLTHEEEKTLGRCIQLAAKILASPDAQMSDAEKRILKAAADAREKFVTSNLRFVEKIARKKGHRRHMSLDDLKQEGLIGLLRATELYDPEMGFRFKTYASWWIEQRIVRAIGNDDRIVRLPIYIQELRNKIFSSRSRLVLTMGRNPTNKELADALGHDEERLMKVLWRIQATDVLDGDSEVGDDTSLLSLVPDDDASPFDYVAYRELCGGIEGALDSLLPREREILKLRFGIDVAYPHTLEMIGKLFNLTRERIRQIESKALRKLEKKHRLLSAHLDN